MHRSIIIANNIGETNKLLKERFNIKETIYLPIYHLQIASFPTATK